MSEDVKKFKLREEKHAIVEIDLMAWSPTMDLLALANSNGEVLVNRLSWQRVWSLPAPSEGDKIRGLAWRPDGKVIAVGYSSGVVRICDVEKGDLVYVGSVRGSVTFLDWMEQSKNMKQGPDLYAEDDSSDYLPVSQQLNSLYSESSSSKDQSGLEAYERFRSLSAQKQLNLLIVGTDLCEVNIFSYGAFPTCIINMSSGSFAGHEIIDSARVSRDLSCLSAIIKVSKVDSTEFFIKTFDTSLMLARHEEIRILASKYVMIASAQMELQVIIQQMCEAWEEILREMDSKLLKFAESKKKHNGGSVSNDFLELLLFGTTSLELQSFLLQDLTDKGLKKLGFSIENSYSNIQKLVVRQLQRVSQNITSHLSDLHGMSQWYDKYGVLGLSPDMVRAAVQVAGAFAVSASELQQVIDASIKNFKAFFRWLYIAILRLSNEHPPGEINKMTQHDIKFVADFLRDNFTHLLGENEYEDEELEIFNKSHGFKLEKVGQYLKKENLVQPPNYSDNPWIQFLQATSFHKNSKVLYPSMQGKSILQRKDLLDDAISNAILEPAKVIGSSVLQYSSFTLFKFIETPKEGMHTPKVAVFTDEKKDCLWIAFTKDYSPCEFLYLLRRSTKDSYSIEGLKIKVGKLGNNPSDGIKGNRSGNNSTDGQWSDRPACGRHLLIDFAVFNTQTLTLMLKEDCDEDITLLLQLPLQSLPNNLFVDLDPSQLHSQCSTITTFDVAPLLPLASINYQNNTVGHSVAVGGIRTTASMLLMSQRRIRLFLLEDGNSDDEEEDEEEEREEDSSHQADSTMDSTRTGNDIGERTEDDDKENIED